MSLADILAAGDKTPFRTASVVSHDHGLTILLKGATIHGVPYLYTAPPVGSIVLLAYVGDQLVCIGPFGNKAVPLAGIAHPYDSSQPFTTGDSYNG